MSIQVGGIYGGSIGGEQHTVTVQPAKTVNATYTEDLTGSSFVRPGTPINYYWVIQDSANNSYTDATQNFVVNDSRFSWQHLTRGLLRVYWYNQPKSFGQVILNHAATSLDRISHHLGVTPYSPINLWIYIDHADFTGAIGPNDGMKQSLRVDVAHLENQWHLFLNQPSTLGGSSSTASNKVTTPNPSAIATTLTVVSLVLVIGAFLAVLLVFVTMRQRRKKLYSESDTATETSHEDM